MNFYTEYEDAVRQGSQIEEILEGKVVEILTTHQVALNKKEETLDHSFIDDETSSVKMLLTTYSTEDAHNNEAVSEREKDIRDFVEDYNSQKADPSMQIRGTFTFEDPSARYCYIATDDVLVHHQKKRTVFRNGRECTSSKGTWIYHTVAYIEADNLIYVMEARSQFMAYACILAFLLNNALTDRFLVFFTDGEETLKTLADSVFSNWPHVCYIDYYHLIDHLKGIFSRAFRPGKVVDESKPVEYFKNGKIKKGSVTRVTRSIAHLEKVKSMLWAGNMNAAIDYLEGLKGSSELKGNEGEAKINEAITYLNNKRDRIVCFAIRKHLGLRNSSNSVEISNNVLVARRQKKKGRSWSSDGSFALSATTAVFVNGEAERYFKKKELLFQPRPKAQDQERKTGLEWIYDAQVNARISIEVEETFVA